MRNSLGDSVAQECALLPERLSFYCDFHFLIFCSNISHIIYFANNAVSSAHSAQYCAYLRVMGERQAILSIWFYNKKKRTKRNSVRVWVRIVFDPRSLMHKTHIRINAPHSPFVYIWIQGACWTLAIFTRTCIHINAYNGKTWKRNFVYVLAPYVDPAQKCSIYTSICIWLRLLAFHISRSATHSPYMRLRLRARYFLNRGNLLSFRV